MATAKKLPSGKWRALLYDYTDAQGKRHYESFTADTKKEAEYNDVTMKHFDNMQHEMQHKK